MLKIRLHRVGRKHEPVFRIVVTDSRTASKKFRRFHEVIGSYDPREKGNLVVDTERAAHWLSMGAQASGTMHNILVDKGVITGKKINVLPKKVVAKKDEPAAEVKAEAAPVAEAPVEETPVEEAPAEVAAEEKPADAQ